jgi:hypothetical protein
VTTIIQVSAGQAHSCKWSQNPKNALPDLASHIHHFSNTNITYPVGYINLINQAIDDEQTEIGWWDFLWGFLTINWHSGTLASACVDNSKEKSIINKNDKDHRVTHQGTQTIYTINHTLIVAVWV